MFCNETVLSYAYHVCYIEYIFINIVMSYVIVISSLLFYKMFGVCTTCLHTYYLKFIEWYTQNNNFSYRLFLLPTNICESLLLFKVKAVVGFGIKFGTEVDNSLE